MFLLDLMIGNRPYKWPCGIKFYIAPILIISTAWISFGVQSFQSFLLTMLWETCSELRWKITFKKHSFKKKTDHDDFISPLFVSNEFVFLKRLKTYSFQDRQGKLRGSYYIDVIVQGWSVGIIIIFFVFFTINIRAL